MVITVETIISITISIVLLLKLKVMADLVCTFCGTTDCTSEYSLKRHLAACSKRFTAYDDDESVNESDKQIPRFASLKNDDDYEQR